MQAEALIEPFLHLYQGEYMPKKKTKAQVKRDLKTIRVKFFRLMVDRGEFGTSSNFPMTISSADKILRSIELLERKVK